MFQIGYGRFQLSPKLILIPDLCMFSIFFFFFFFFFFFVFFFNKLSCYILFLITTFSLYVTMLTYMQSFRLERFLQLLGQLSVNLVSSRCSYIPVLNQAPPGNFIGVLTAVIRDTACHCVQKNTIWQISKN